MVSSENWRVELSQSRLLTGTGKFANMLKVRGKKYFMRDTVKDLLPLRVVELYLVSVFLVIFL